MERFGAYQFKILKNNAVDGWYYQIGNDEISILRESKEFFKYEGIARFAAIGHISLLEQGKG
jgi:hypothetical protein